MMRSQAFQNVDPVYMQYPRAQLDNYWVQQTLGKGAYGKVKLVEDDSGQKYAAKIFHGSDPESIKAFKEMQENEVSIMQKIVHPCIIRVINTNANGTYRTEKNKTKKVQYIIMELAEGGVMIDYLMQTGPFSSAIARAYFFQMIGAVNEIHQRGFSHRDLKPENILFDVNANLKICDFGLATYSAGRKGNEMLYSQIGTPEYMAPEIHEGKAYNGPCVDLFACGMILFIMVTGRPPFFQPTKSDPWYKKFNIDNQGYWQKHNEMQRKQSGKSIEPDFIDLINKMLAYDPNERLTYEQIISHPWINGQVATSFDITNDFQQKLLQVKGEQEGLRLLKEAERQKQGVVRSPNQFKNSTGISQSRALQTSLVYKSEGGNSLEVRIPYYAKAPLKFSQFLTTLSPEEIVAELDSWLGKNALNYDVLEQEYKIKASFKEDGNDVSIQFKLYHTDGDLFLIDIIKESGNQYTYQQIIKKIISSDEVQEMIDRTTVA